MITGPWGHISAHLTQSFRIIHFALYSEHGGFASMEGGLGLGDWWLGPSTPLDSRRELWAAAHSRGHVHAACWAPGSGRLLNTQSERVVMFLSPELCEQAAAPHGHPPAAAAAQDPGDALRRGCPQCEEPAGRAAGLREQSGPRCTPRWVPTPAPLGTGHSGPSPVVPPPLVTRFFLDFAVEASQCSRLHAVITELSRDTTFRAGPASLCPVPTQLDAKAPVWVFEKCNRLLFRAVLRSQQH